MYYNRFRYYSPDSGCYISQDPIGLAGGMPNLYAYVEDCNSRLDPLGLEGTGLNWNNGMLGPNDVDWRGSNNTLNDALDKAFKNTGVNSSEFEVTKWGKNKYGKSVPVEWKGPNGAEVNMDFAHTDGFDKHGKWATGPDAPHVGWQIGKKGDKKVGHILLDDVPAGRVKCK